MTVPINTYSWSNLPAQDVLDAMSSKDMFSLVKHLDGQKIADPPQEALNWVIACSPELSQLDAIKNLTSVVSNSRYRYVSDMQKNAGEKFRTEPVSGEILRHYKTLLKRKSRLLLGCVIGLRDEHQETWIYAVIHSENPKTRKNIMVDEQSELYILDGYYQERMQQVLMQSEALLDVIEQGLPPLAPSIIKARLAELINAPFNPTDDQVESTRRQMSDYGYTARAMMHREHEQHIEHLKSWLDDLNALTPIEPARLDAPTKRPGMGSR